MNRSDKINSIIKIKILLESCIFIYPQKVMSLEFLLYLLHHTVIFKLHHTPKITRNMGLLSYVN